MHWNFHHHTAFASWQIQQLGFVVAKTLTVNGLVLCLGLVIKKISNTFHGQKCVCFCVIHLKQKAFCQNIECFPIVSFDALKNTNDAKMQLAEPIHHHLWKWLVHQQTKILSQCAQLVISSQRVQNVTSKRLIHCSLNVIDCTAWLGNLWSIMSLSLLGEIHHVRLLLVLERDRWFRKPGLHDNFGAIHTKFSHSQGFSKRSFQSHECDARIMMSSQDLPWRKHGIRPWRRS